MKRAERRERMENRQDAPAKPTTVPLRDGAAAALEEINLILRDLGFRVKTAALVEVALIELKEQMKQRERAVEIVRRRVDPKNDVVLPP
jgi:hypothetical protein